MEAGRPRSTIVRAAIAVLLAACALAAVPMAPATAAEGQEVLCNQAGYGCTEGTGYAGQGIWGGNYGKTGHNCTSYVSYMLARNGASQPWRPMGNANQWNERAAGKAVVDDNPVVGSVAHWEGGTRLAPGASGHVAYVEIVTSSYIEITDDTHSGGTRRIRIHRGSPYWPSSFVHIHDIGSSPSLAGGGWSLSNTKAEAPAEPVSVAFGEAGDVPVAGNWDGKGSDSVGVFRDGLWLLSNATPGTPGRTIEVTFGQAGDLPVVGDWDGNGTDTIGVFRAGTWILSNVNGFDAAQTFSVAFGELGDAPVVGDWDGRGGDTVGVYRRGTWILTNSHYAGLLGQEHFEYGEPGDLPVVGNWDGVRGDAVGLYRNGTWLLATLAAEGPPKAARVVFGKSGDAPVVGDWDGRAGDTIGLAL
jgi:surface antigen